MDKWSKDYNSIFHFQALQTLCVHFLWNWDLPFFLELQNVAPFLTMSFLDYISRHYIQHLTLKKSFSKFKITSVMIVYNGNYNRLNIIEFHNISTPVDVWGIDGWIFISRGLLIEKKQPQYFSTHRRNITSASIH